VIIHSIFHLFFFPLLPTFYLSSLPSALLYLSFLSLFTSSSNFFLFSYLFLPPSNLSCHFFLLHFSLLSLSLPTFSLTPFSPPHSLPFPASPPLSLTPLSTSLLFFSLLSVYSYSLSAQNENLLACIFSKILATFDI